MFVQSVFGISGTLSQGLALSLEAAERQIPVIKDFLLCFLPTGAGVSGGLNVLPMAGLAAHRRITTERMDASKLITLSRLANYKQ